MQPALISPASTSILGIPANIIYILIPLAGVGIFIYILFKRLVPLLKAAPDDRFNRLTERIQSVLKIWLAQWRHPRYMLAGVVHILLFAGFLILGARSTQLVFIGFVDDFTLPGFGGGFGSFYNVLKDYAATWVLIAVAIAAVRRAIIKPARYAVPPQYGRDHTWEALLVLGLIATLVISESFFEASLVAAEIQKGLHAQFVAPLTLVWLFKHLLSGASSQALQGLHSASYFIHEIAFFFFLCFLPMGKHFHVVTSLFNVFFMRLEKGNVKPVRHGVDDEGLDDLESFGVKVFEDFTWKHMLDFYTCADCGRCSDRCPANAVSRPLSPRFISIKGRDYAFKHYPILGPLGPLALHLAPGVATFFKGTHRLLQGLGYHTLIHHPASEVHHFVNVFNSQRAFLLASATGGAGPNLILTIDTANQRLRLATIAAKDRVVFKCVIASLNRNEPG